MVANRAILGKFLAPKNLSVEGFQLFSCLPLEARERPKLKTVIFLVGMVLNSLALITAGKRSFKQERRSRTNVHYLVFHLTIADSITCFLTMPMETLWKLTLEAS